MVDDFFLKKLNTLIARSCNTFLSVVLCKLVGTSKPSSSTSLLVPRLKISWNSVALPIQVLLSSNFISTMSSSLASISCLDPGPRVLLTATDFTSSKLSIPGISLVSLLLPLTINLRSIRLFFLSY